VLNEEVPVDSNSCVGGECLMIVVVKLQLLVTVEIGGEHMLKHPCIVYAQKTWVTFW
jgi:hypothetical protein